MSAPPAMCHQTLMSLRRAVTRMPQRFTRWLKRISGRHHTPHMAILVTAALSVLICVYAAAWFVVTSIAEFKSEAADRVAMKYLKDDDRPDYDRIRCVSPPP